MKEQYFICEWCHQFFVPKYRVSKKRKGEKPRFCNTSCSAKWRMNRPGYAKSHITKKGRETLREHLLKVRERADVQEKLNQHLRSPTSNPFFWATTRRKAQEALKERNYEHLTGGNGSGLTVPQQMLQDCLGWIAEYIVPVNPWQPGLPKHYKLDIANPIDKIAIEIDGRSHRTRAVKESDKKKADYLRSQGWTVLRFQNEEILQDLNSVMQRIVEAMSSTTSKPEPETTSPTRS